VRDMSENWGKKVKKGLKDWEYEARFSSGEEITYNEDFNEMIKVIVINKN
jgi:hypothetical protein